MFPAFYHGNIIYHLGIICNRQRKIFSGPVQGAGAGRPVPRPLHKIFPKCVALCPEKPVYYSEGQPPSAGFTIYSQFVGGGCSCNLYKIYAIILSEYSKMTSGRERFDKLQQYRKLHFQSCPSGIANGIPYMGNAAVWQGWMGGRLRPRHPCGNRHQPLHLAQCEKGRFSSPKGKAGTPYHTGDFTGFAAVP